MGLPRPQSGSPCATPPERVVLDFPGYGYRRVTHALRRAGWGPINHKRVLRVMREESLLCQLKRRFIVTTDSAHGSRTYPNRLKGAPLDRLDQAWVADITYIRLPTTFVYLACIRRRLLASLHRLEAVAADRHAPDVGRAGDGHRAPQPGLIHHSDRGVQYASSEYVSHLEEIGRWGRG
jgi:putative transposase